MEETTLQRSDGGRRKRVEAATFAVRLGAFAASLVPFPAVLAPWATLDGIGGAHSGVGLVALLATRPRPTCTAYLLSKRRSCPWGQ